RQNPDHRGSISTPWKFSRLPVIVVFPPGASVIVSLPPSISREISTGFCVVFVTTNWRDVAQPPIIMQQREAESASAGSSLLRMRVLLLRMNHVRRVVVMAQARIQVRRERVRRTTVADGAV